MDYLLLARVGKLVALLGFVLPWVTVSCSGTEMLQATGWQLMTGDPQPVGAFAQAQDQAEDAEPSITVILAFAVIIAALGASFLAKGRVAAGVLLAGAVAGIALSYFSMTSLRTEMTRELTQSQDQPVQENPYFSADQQRELAQAAVSAIRIEEQEGYWLTLGALGVAGILSLIVLAGVGAAPVRRDDGTG